MNYAFTYQLVHLIAQQHCTCKLLFY